jgi:hypothetical protein
MLFDPESNPTCSQALAVARTGSVDDIQKGRKVSDVRSAEYAIRSVVRNDQRRLRRSVKAALNIGDISARRLPSVEQTAIYLCLSEREIYNMLSTKQLAGVRHGKRLMVDIRDLEEWIEGHKVACPTFF